MVSILWTVGGGILSLHLPAYASNSGKQSDNNQVTVDESLTTASVDDVELLNDGLKAWVPIDSIDRRVRRALLIVTYANSMNAAHLLINHGANVNNKDQSRDSQYLYAGAEGKLEILKMTVTAGADLQSVNRLCWKFTRLIRYRWDKLLHNLSSQFCSVIGVSISMIALSLEMGRSLHMSSLDVRPAAVVNVACAAAYFHYHNRCGCD